MFKTITTLQAELLTAIFDTQYEHGVTRHEAATGETNAGTYVWDAILDLRCKEKGKGGVVAKAVEAGLVVLTSDSDPDERYIYATPLGARSLLAWEAEQRTPEMPALRAAIVGRIETAKAPTTNDLFDVFLGV